MSKSPNAIRDELQQHIARRAADLQAQGLSPADATRRAHEEFGAVAVYEAQCRREQKIGHATRVMSGLGGDIVYGWRRLKATPIFTVFAVISLAVGIGVTTALYSAIAGLFFDSAGVPGDERVAVVVGSSVYAGGRYEWTGIVSHPDFEDIAGNVRGFERTAASMQFFQAAVTDDRSDTVIGEAVTGDYFATVGIGTEAGRLLDGSDDRARRSVAVISDEYWRKAFGRSTAAVGTVIRIGGKPFEIVGVAGDGFEGLALAMARKTAVWIPYETAALLPGMAARMVEGARDRRILTVVGRLAGGVEEQQAAAELATLAKQLDAAHPITTRHWERGAIPVTRAWSVRTVRSAHAEQADMLRRTGWIIFVLVAMVLVVACTNLANLTLARGTALLHEQSVRLSLGASRWRLLRALCVESAMVALLGAIGAFAVIRLLLYWFTAEVPMSQAFTVQLAPEVDGTVLLVAAASVLVSLVVFGVSPALRLTRGDLRSNLAGGAAAVISPRRLTERRATRWQVAIATGFFLIATMSVRSVVTQARHDSGIDLDRLSVAFASFYVQRWDEDRARRAVDATLREMAKQPELESGAVSSGMPFGTTTTPFAQLTRAGGVFVKGRRYPDALALVSTPGIFRTLGVPILRGRGFDERDHARSHPVIVMNEIAARDLFGTVDVVGRELTWQISPGQSTVPSSPITAQVIGVAGDTDAQFLMRRSSGAVYVPFAQRYETHVAFVGRARGDTRKATDAIRAAVREADPELAITTAGPAAMLLAGAYYTMRIVGTTSVLLGLLALLLSMAGLHGLLSQMVTMRTREVGLRMALGAERGQILRMVLSDGFRPVLQGLAIGLFIGVAGRAILRATMAPQIGLFDAVSLAVIPIPVMAAGFLACYWPARRAADVDPNVALRAL